MSFKGSSAFRPYVSCYSTTNLRNVLYFSSMMLSFMASAFRNMHTVAI